MTTLKPLSNCPFCGSNNVKVSDDGIDETHYKSVGCSDCQCGTAYGEGEAEAIASWNHRTLSPEIAGALKEAEKWLKWCVECSEAEGYTRPSAHPDQLRGMRAALARIEGVK